MTNLMGKWREGRRAASSFLSLCAPRTRLACVVALGCVQAAVYWLAGLSASTTGTAPIPQPDTLLYCQAARRIVEGAPFSFTAGTAVSTGTTSVLHPFVLAVPYALGMRGESLLAAGFVLNAFFYLVFLAGWTAAFGAWCARPRGAVLASLLLALFGPTAFAAFSQSDIGLWMAVSALLAYALSRPVRTGLSPFRWGLAGALLVLAPWVRPEGMVCVVAFVLAGLSLPLLGVRRRYGVRGWLVAGLAVASVAGVFALNHALTGTCQFSSVAHKGHFANLPFFSALHKTGCDFLEMAKSLCCGQAVSAPRMFHLLPVWGGIFFGFGLVHLRPRRAGAGLAVLALAGLGGLVTVAQSGWQNTNYDRYLAWIFPLVVFCTAEGVVAVTARLRAAGDRPGVRPWCRGIPAALSVLFALGGSVAAVCAYARNCAHMEGERHFMRACERTLPPGASVGGFCGVGMAYGFSDRRFAHLSGIYSPEFPFHDEAAIVEDLKHHPAKRFDYWLLDANEDFTCVAAARDEVLGPDVLAGPARLELRKADWRAFDRAAEVPVPPTDAGTLRDRLDVGAPAEERAHAYRTFDRYGRGPREPLVAVDRLKGERAIEAGRLVTGGDEFDVSTRPGRPLTVVFRTLAKAAAQESDGFFSEIVTGTFGPQLSLRVQVDGEEACVATVDCPSAGFGDVAFTIPGGAIRRETTHLALLGDHVVFGYWFFQAD